MQVALELSVFSPSFFYLRSNTALKSCLLKRTAPQCQDALDGETVTPVDRRLGLGEQLGPRSPTQPSSGCWPRCLRSSLPSGSPEHIFQMRKLKAGRERMLDRVTFLFKNQEWNVHFGFWFCRQISALVATPCLDLMFWAIPSWNRPGPTIWLCSQGALGVSPANPGSFPLRGEFGRRKNYFKKAK